MAGEVCPMAAARSSSSGGGSSGMPQPWALPLGAGGTCDSQPTSLPALVSSSWWGEENGGKSLGTISSSPLFFHSSSLLPP